MRSINTMLNHDSYYSSIQSRTSDMTTRPGIQHPDSFSEVNRKIYITTSRDFQVESFKTNEMNKRN